MKIEIGKDIKQLQGYSAFIPVSFPPNGIFDLPPDILIKTAEADRLVGKLDGITHTLPDVDFFLSMFVAKDATSSAQIEGTKATMVDAIEKSVGVSTKPANASFVPPTVEEMNRALNDFEKFLYDEKSTLPLIHAALMHAQFETIHPFLDGNGRTGRLLVTMLLCHRNLLERPVLFLSSYFKKHQKIYYQKLQGYHYGEVGAWLNFFLDGVIETANDSI